MTAGVPLVRRPAASPARPAPASVASVRRRAAALLALALLAVVAATAGAAQLPSLNPAAAALTATPIKHVVVIYQENHSFDDLLGEVCEQRSTPCNGYTGPVTFKDGKTARNVVQPDIVPFVLHTTAGQLLGMQNRWDRIDGCTKAPYICVSHVPIRHIPNLAALADKYVVSDATFASNPYASFGMHVELAAGTADGFLGTTPRPSTTGAPLGPGFGCDSNRDTLWQRSPSSAPLQVPACVPDAEGQGPYRVSPVRYVPTVMERFEQAGLSWHIYQGVDGQTSPEGLWSICTYFYWCDAQRFTPSYNSPTADFVTAARTGNLPNLSLMMPTADDSQHNHRSMTVGDNYIGGIVRAAMTGPEWKSTAIFLVYDDCGCFYDHVKPPPGLGVRAPVVIVSPWAKRHYTDHTTAVQPYSVLAFLEYDFGTAPLSRDVNRAYDYSDAFDFSQRPQHGIPMVTTPISRHEKRILARMPSIENDPT